MKRRIRTLVRRSKWTLVEVQPLPDLMVDDPNFGLYPADANMPQYKKLCEWCQDNVHEDEWTASFVQPSRADGGIKRFAFKDEKYAAWFKLMTMKGNK